MYSSNRGWTGGGTAPRDHSLLGLAAAAVWGCVVMVMVADDCSGGVSGLLCVSQKVDPNASVGGWGMALFFDAPRRHRSTPVAADICP